MRAGSWREPHCGPSARLSKSGGRLPRHGEQGSKRRSKISTARNGQAMGFARGATRENAQNARPGGLNIHITKMLLCLHKFALKLNPRSVTSEAPAMECSFKDAERQIRQLEARVAHQQMLAAKLSR